MSKPQFLPIFLGRRYARPQYFWVQNFQGIHVFGFEFYPPYAHPRIQIYEVTPWETALSEMSYLLETCCAWFLESL